jgi:hypothetical protein
VIRAIESFDQLARKEYADVEPRTLLPDRVRVRQPEWNAAVEALLVDVLDVDGTKPVESRIDVHVSA